MTTPESLKTLISEKINDLGATSTRFRPALLAALKERSKTERQQLEAQLVDDGDGLKCAKALSRYHDELISSLYDLAVNELYPVINPSTSEHLAVVAVGGYGRGALAPGSDIDLLFVLPYKQTAWGESVVEFLLYFLWDLGLKVGHATRTVNESIRLAQTDGTILTSILEARQICGDAALFDDLQTRFDKDIVSSGTQAFIRDKLDERNERHLRAGESRYLVEPNVKESKGGLRDLNTLFWIARFVHRTDDKAELVKAGLFDEDDIETFSRCESFLWTVRCHLHFMSRRGDDRLGFDRQMEVADRMGFQDKGRKKAVEFFMHQYFLVAKDVGDLTRILCAVLEEREIKALPRVNAFLKSLRFRKDALTKYGDFQLDRGRLNFADDTACMHTPLNMLKLFEVSARENLAIHPKAYKCVRRSIDSIDKDLRNSSAANQTFMSLLLDTDDPESILRRLNENGVLGQFIPDFGKIVAMMQFNMYHHFTVDEHLIRAVGILASIENGELAKEHPMASRLISNLSASSRQCLYLAVLFHDIAKGREESHSVAGERIAREECPRLGLTQAETETVAFLVRQHLIMSDTAQTRDLNDFKTILDFTAVVQSPERLKLLLILTVVDIRAVGPGVWNGWKGQLLRNLFDEAEPVLSGGHSRISRQDRIDEAQAAFREAADVGQGSDLVDYLDVHYDPYWLTLDTKTQLGHAHLYRDALNSGSEIASTVSTDEFTAITEITVLAPDHPRLLSLLTGACAANGANIASAQIFTTQTGLALDTLMIQRTLDETGETLRAERICELIENLLRGKKRLSQLEPTDHSSDPRRESFSVPPNVTIDNESSNKHTVIELTGLDRIGLLHDLTEALFNLNLNISSAHISTYGERAVDVFYVSDLTGGKIETKNRQNQISEVMLAALAADKPSGKAA